MPEILFLHKPELRDTLLSELRETYPLGKNHVVGPSEVLASLEQDQPGARPLVAFAIQALPNAVQIQAPSVAKWSAAAVEQIIAALKDDERPWRLVMSAAAVPENRVGPRRMTLIREGIIELLKKRQRSILRRLVDDHGGMSESGLVQIHFLGLDVGWLSACDATLVSHYSSVIAPAPFGDFQIAEDKQPPSRAYRKLLEAELRLATLIEKNDSCVDLGCTPGSWSYVALGRGARVIGVDRTPPRSDILGDSRMRFVKGDAFSYEPESKVRWLLSDVIAFPERSLELLKTWLENDWCERFVVTIKFRGKDDYGKLGAFRKLLSERCDKCFLTSLWNNKNEVTCAGIIG